MNSARPNRRQIFTAGAVVAVSTVAVSTATSTEAAFGGPYGSGDLGAWQAMSKAISTETQIKRVLATNGVFMFGDSIAVQDGKTLATRLIGRDGSQLAVHNWSGRPTSGAVDAMAQWATAYGLTRRILMATGSNDIFDPPRFAAQVDRAMKLAGSNRYVYWVNVHATRWSKTAAIQMADQRNSAWVNLQLSDAQKKYPNLRIIRWAEYLAAKPSRITSYLRDGVHTSITLGQDARNELTVQSLVAPLPAAK